MYDMILNYVVALFTLHPEENNQTWWGHFKFAAGMFCVLFTLATASLVHAIFPFCFQNTLSEKLNQLNNSIKSRDE